MSRHCISCGYESCGNVLVGIRVPLCDSCLMHHAITTVGLPMARGVVAEIDAVETTIVHICNHCADAADPDLDMSFLQLGRSGQGTRY